MAGSEPRGLGSGCAAAQTHQVPQIGRGCSLLPHRVSQAERRTEHTARPQLRKGSISKKIFHVIFNKRKRKKKTQREKEEREGGKDYKGKKTERKEGKTKREGEGGEEGKREGERKEKTDWKEMSLAEFTELDPKGPLKGSRQRWAAQEDRLESACGSS